MQLEVVTQLVSRSDGRSHVYVGIQGYNTIFGSCQELRQNKKFQEAVNLGVIKVSSQIFRMPKRVLRR